MTDPDAATPSPEDEATTAFDYDAARPGDLLPEGSKVGRYRIGRTMGIGGMGVVYEAFDPQLDRRVALKFVTFAEGAAEDQQRARERMLREAQVLAVLSHPNVVTVYDAGTVDNAVFIAMELVEGLTLAEWIQRDKPELSEIIRTYCAAGEGLSAAHRAGLVHRDFKPQNVLLGSDRRVRVIDFGVARATDDVSASADGLGGIRPPEVTAPNRAGLSSPLTVQGAILGTPRYMSPEQRERKLADARSDQYCFCASLYEAVYGAAPLPGTDLQKSSLDTGTNGKTPPRWLRKLLLRGLCPDPSQRFADMDGLLSELRRDRRAWLTRATVAVAIAVAVAAVSVASLREGPETRCKRGSTQSRNMWTEPSRAHFRGMLEGAGAYGVDSLYASIDKGLERFFSAYEASYVQACEATFVRAAQSSALLDLRMSCLERRRLQVQSVIQHAGDDATNQTLQRIPEALDHLADVSHCDDTEALQQIVPKPEDPKLAARIKTLEKELDKVEALTLSGKYQDADKLAKATYQKVQAVDYAPLRAETLFRMGSVDGRLARYDEALDHYQGAVLSAATGKDIPLAARAYIRAMATHMQKSELQEGLALSLPTQVLLALQPSNLTLRAYYDSILGLLRFQNSQFTEAETSFREALKLRASARAPDDLDTAALLVNFGPVLMTLGKGAEAKSVLSRAAEIAESLLGPDNPNMAEFLGNLAFVYAEEGDAEKAAALERRVLRVQRATLGDKHPMVGIATLNLGSTMRRLGRWEEAEELLGSGLAILEGSLSPDHAHVAAARVEYAATPYEKGDYEEALRRYADAIVKMRAQGHAESEWMVSALDATAVASLATGQLILAATSVNEALRLSRKIYGESNERFVHALATRSRLVLLQGRVTDAGNDASRVLELLDKREPERTALNPTEKLSAAIAHFVLAQLTRGSDPEGARNHANAAQRLLQDDKTLEAKSLLADLEQVGKAPR